jgi:PAS domain S-box-containing protein
MKLITGKSRELLDLGIVLIVAAILSILSISIHTLGRLYSFVSVYTDLPLAEFLINVSFLSLAGLLWVTYIRWRKAAKRQAELENIISSINPDVLLVVDSDRTIIECNNSLKRMFGYEVNEVINHKTDFLYFEWPSDQSNQDDWHEIYEKLNRNGFHIGSAIGKKKNGEAIPLEIITGNLSDRGGAVQLLRDVTERKRAEEVLRESEGRFRRFTSAVTDVIYRYDPENNQYDFISPSFELQTGYSLEEIKSDPSGVTRRITHPGDAERALKEVDDHIKKGPGAGTFCTEYRVIRRDGQVIWVSDCKDIEFTSDGNVSRINGVIRDITERKRMEEALQESEEKYRTLVETAQEGIGITDPDENFAFVNQALAEALGYDKGELSGMNLSQLSTEEEFTKFKEQTEKRKQGKTSKYETTLLTKDNKLKYFMVSAASLWSEEGGFAGTLGVLTDITERKQAEEALRESEEKFRSLAEESPNMIFINRKGRVVYANEKCEEIMGYKREEFYSSDFDFFTLIAPESKELVKANFSSHIKDKEVDPLEYTLITKEGKRIAAILNTKLIRYGGESAILGIVTDITERRRAEEALRKSEERLSAFMDSAPDGFGLFDSELNLVDLNETGVRMFPGGTKKEDIIGKNITELYPIKEIGRFDKYREVIKTGKSFVVDDIVPHPKFGDVRLAVSAFKVDNGLGIIATDVTERMRTEEKLRDYTRQIEEKNLELNAKNQELTATRAQLVQREKLRALGQMASGVAHSFNNLLAIILGRAQLLHRKAKELEIEKGLRSIERAALDAGSAVKRIQDFARVRKDQEFKWVDIDEVIEDVIALTKTKWKDQAEADGISIRLEVQKDRRKLPPVAGEESELRDVFTNIIFNAVEAMPKGGEIAIKTQTDRKSVSVSFTDSGTGMPEEIKQKIFDPFFTTKGVKNTGLGLSVAYGIIQRHQGDIQVESKQGKGTTVVVRFPVSKTLAKKQGKEEELEEPSLPDRSAKILVIEDEEDVRGLLFDILASANYKVKLASGGAEGLEIYKKEKFDIVLTDLGMPRTSGWEVAKAIREIDSDSIVFLITGWGVEMDEEKLKESGIDQVVSKPIKVETLLTLISETMESKKRTKESGEETLGYPVECKEPQI